MIEEVCSLHYRNLVTKLYLRIQLAALRYKI